MALSSVQVWGKISSISLNLVGIVNKRIRTLLKYSTAARKNKELKLPDRAKLLNWQSWVSCLYLRPLDFDPSIQIYLVIRIMELKQNTGVAQNLTESESLMNILYLVPHKTFLLQVAFGVGGLFGWELDWTP